MLWAPLLLLSSVSSYKILVFSPTISRSHMISNGRIADELAKAGHDVVLFEPDFLNIFEKVQAAKLARRWPVQGFNDDLLNVLLSFSKDVFEELTAGDLIRGEMAYQGAYNSMCKQIIENDELLQQLKDEHFDAYFGEQINVCGHGLAHALGIKVHFWISSCPIFEGLSMVTGLPTPVSVVPAGGMPLYTNPTYYDRAVNLFSVGLNYLCSAYNFRQTTAIFRGKFGPDFPNVGEIAGNSDVVFISSDEFVEISRPEMPNFVHIGGLGLGGKKSASLDETFEREVNEGKSGVIFFSLGTIVNTTLLPPTIMDNLVKVAKTLPDYQFIVRADHYDTHARRVAVNVANFKVHDWVPQVPLLNHPKMRLFITHSGYNGIMEAARAGVPLLTVPFMFDQTKNSQAVTQNGWGLALDKKALRDDAESVVTVIEELLSNDKYKKAALRIQRLIVEKPFNASERLVKTTNFVISNGGVKELLSPTRHHSFVHYYCLDILVPLFFVIFAVFYAILRLSCRCCCPQNKRVKVKTN